MLGLLWLKTTQTVIAAQFNQHPTRLMLFQQSRKARQSLLRGVAADAGINYRRFTLPLIIQQGRPGRAGRHSIPGAQAITQNQ
ncbi:Uncharacterised protein [Shigella sonnei]|nr:Uncharacterised protein [Shigella sonnei]